MKILVTAASRHDRTGDIARSIGRALQSRGFAATVARPEDVRSVSRYDAVLVGSGVHKGHWMRDAHKLVRRSAQELASRPVWLFSNRAVTDATDIALVTHARGYHVFAGSDDVNAWVDEIAEQLGANPAA